MFNETVRLLSETSPESRELVLLIAAVVTIIVAVIKIPRYVRNKILSSINHRKYFREVFLYEKAKKLQQSDFGIQPPHGVNKEVYKRKKSDYEVENYLKDSKDLLIIGMPEAGKTRSAYQAIKSVLPEFYAIKPPAEKLSDFTILPPKKNYLIFFDDLNKFADVNFDFRRFLDKFNGRSKRMIVLSTCRSGDEFDDFTGKSMKFFRRFKIVDLNDYPLSEAEGEQLAEDVGVEWKPEQFNGTPGSVVLDDGDMKERYKRLDDPQKVIMRACKLLRSANSFTYKKDLLKNVCAHIFETEINENGWIDSINRLENNSLITRTERSINKINVYDSTLDSVVCDYSPEDHLLPLLEFLTKSRDAKSIFYLGNAFIEKKDHENAEKCYRKSLEFNPDCAPAHNNLGALLAKLERYDGAEEEFREAIRADSDDIEAHYNFGVLLNDLKRYGEVEREYREAIRIDPDHVGAHNNLGGLLKYLKRYDGAEEEFREAIRADSDDIEAHYNFGVLLNDLKRYGEVEREYREAIRIDPDHVGAHNNLGGLLKYLKRYDGAEEEFREAIRADPDCAEAHANLGTLFRITDRPEEAKSELKIAKQIFENQGRAEDVKTVEVLLANI